MICRRTKEGSLKKLIPIEGLQLYGAWFTPTHTIASDIRGHSPPQVCVAICSRMKREGTGKFHHSSHAVMSCS